MPRIYRVKQVTESHCGPAVCQMLLSFLGSHATQGEIVAAAGCEDIIFNRGMLIEELAKGVKKVAPFVTFWFKENATLWDLQEISEKHKHPVAVEWQGLFYATEKEEKEEAGNKSHDFGHYSIVKEADKKTDRLVMLDPYPPYYKEDRIFSLKWFEKRWWDENDVTKGGYDYVVHDKHAMFLITKKGTFFPKNLGMKPL